MLSIIDLIEAGTIASDLAAYLMAVVGKGASFMVGAVPGGAGKTTVMGSLLNLIPTDVKLRAADGMGTIEEGLTTPRPRGCYICHEIGSGPYYAYLWGEELRAYFRLGVAGHILATNLHADTPEQACRQVCETNRVPEAHFRRMHLLVFLSVNPAARPSRQVAEVWESDGESPHRKLYQRGSGRMDHFASAWATRDDLDARMRTIDQLTSAQARTIEQVRAFLLGPSR